MLIPKKVKHRKWHKLRSSGLQIATTKLSLSFGEFGLKAVTPAWVNLAPDRSRASRHGALHQARAARSGSASSPINR